MKALRSMLYYATSKALGEIVIKNLYENPKTVVIFSSYYVMFSVFLVANEKNIDHLISLFKIFVCCTWRTVDAEGSIPIQAIDEFMHSSRELWLSSAEAASLHDKYRANLRDYLRLYVNIIDEAEKQQMLEYFETADTVVGYKIFPWQGKPSAYLWLWLHLNSPCKLLPNNTEREFLFLNVIMHLENFILCSVCRNEYEKYQKNFIHNSIVCGEDLTLIFIKAHWFINYNGIAADNSHGILSTARESDVRHYLEKSPDLLEKIFGNTINNNNDTEIEYRILEKRLKYLQFMHGSQVDRVITSIYHHYIEIKAKLINSTLTYPQQTITKEMKEILNHTYEKNEF